MEGADAVTASGCEHMGGTVWELPDIMGVSWGGGHKTNEFF